MVNTLMMTVTSDSNISYKHYGHDVLIISFGGLALRMGMTMFEFDSAIKKLKVDSLFLKDTKRIWYQKGISEEYPTVESVVELLKKYTVNYKKVICIGNSAGAFAAILFGTLLDVDQVVAFAPQTLLKEDFNMKPWLKELRNMNKHKIFCNDLKEHLKNINYTTKIDICVPILNPIDYAHSNHIKDLKNINIKSFKTNNHNMAGYIKNTIGIDKFLETYI